MIENFRYSFEENEIIVKKLLKDGNFFTSNSTLERLIPRTNFNAKNNKVTPIESILTPEEISYINQFPDRKYFYFIVSHKIKKEDLFCPICGNFKKKYKTNAKLYDTCGNPACYNKLISDKNRNKSPEEKLKIRKKREAFFENKYGPGIINNTQVPEVKEKIKATNLKNFGTEWPGSSDIVKFKIKKTNQERRGVDYPFQSKEVQDKIPQTFLNKYGTTNINAEEWKKEKAKQTTVDRYGVESYYLSVEAEEYRKELRRKTCDKYWELLSKSTVEPLFTREEYNGGFDTFLFKCKLCQTEFTDYLWHDHIPNCPVCRKNGISSKEKEVYFFLKGIYKNQILKNDRFILENNNEIDIYLLQDNIGIEFDGLYYHSIGLGEVGKSDKNYHLSKTEECLNKGISLIHIFESDWVLKRDIVEDILKRKLNLITINNDDVNYSFITPEVAKAFLEKNNILGYDRASFLNIGCFLNKNLIAVMSLEKLSFNNKKAIKISRFCEELNFHNKSVLKGFISFIENNIEGTLLAECDRRYFLGSSYKEAGFSFLRETKPRAWYIKGYNLFSEEYCKDHIYNNKNNKEFDEVMLHLGYRIIYDCGQNVFIKEVKSC